METHTHAGVIDETLTTTLSLNGNTSSKIFVKRQQISLRKSLTCMANFLKRLRILESSSSW
jgi:hypothetical protein